MSEQPKLTMADVKLLNADIARHYEASKENVSSILMANSEAGQVLRGLMMLKAIERSHGDLVPYDAVHQARKNFAEWRQELGDFSGPSWKEPMMENKDEMAKALAGDFFAAVKSVVGSNVTLEMAMKHIADLKKVQAQGSAHEGTVAAQPSQEKSA